MSQHLLAIRSLCSILLIGACSTKDRAETQVAQTESNTIIIAVTADANAHRGGAQGHRKTTPHATWKAVEQLGEDAQADASSTVAAGQVAFLKLREQHWQEMVTKLLALDRSAAALATQAESATGGLQAEFMGRLRLLQGRREAFAARCRALEAESAETWAAAKAGIDQEWDELKALAAER